MALRRPKSIRSGRDPVEEILNEEMGGKWCSEAERDSPEGLHPPSVWGCGECAARSTRPKQRVSIQRLSIQPRPLKHGRCVTRMESYSQRARQIYLQAGSREMQLGKGTQDRGRNSGARVLYISYCIRPVGGIRGRRFGETRYGSAMQYYVHEEPREGQV